MNNNKELSFPLTLAFWAFLAMLAYPVFQMISSVQPLNAQACGLSQCTGDINCSCTVTIDEITACQNVANNYCLPCSTACGGSGNPLLRRCDPECQNSVSIAELIQMVNNAQNGCSSGTGCDSLNHSGKPSGYCNDNWVASVCMSLGCC